MTTRRDRAIGIELPAGRLEGDLVVPPGAGGLVVFAHGSGSSRHSPRNRLVAGALQDAGFATLLLDLLTPAEAADRDAVFDIGLLATRLDAARRRVAREPAAAALRVAYFGASTGAAAALVAAAADPSIAAVVSRGGRPDLASAALGRVGAPTLLIVGGADDQVLELNRRAYDALACEKSLAIVPGATHLFEEPGALDEVVRLAIDWLARHLARPGHAGASADPPRR